MEYFKTDDLQWCRKVSDHEFDLVEVRERGDDEYIYVAGSIDIDDYLAEDPVRGYYESVEKVKKDYGDEWAQIVAECIFEQTHEIELICFGPFKSEDAAEKAAEEYIKVQRRYDAFRIRKD